MGLCAAKLDAGGIQHATQGSCQRDSLLGFASCRADDVKVAGTKDRCAKATPESCRDAHERRARIAPCRGNPQGDGQRHTHLSQPLRAA